MKIVTLDGKVIFENEAAPTKKALFQEALNYGITDYSNVDFTDFDFEGLKIANCLFAKALFERTRLQQVWFDTCHFEEATFSHCPTYLTRMRSCNLDKCNFDQVHMGNVEMFMCTLRGANLVNLGMTAKGYMVVMSYEKGLAIIRAGCQELTLEEAKERYPESNNDEEGARVTLARRIAHQRGWIPAVAKGEILVVEPIVEAMEELPAESNKEEAQTVNA